MLIIINTAKTLRNHWKKSVFASLLLGYGGNYIKNYLETQNLMRVYCQKATKYGNESIALYENPRHVTVILNPKANKHKAAEEFEKYCAPLLHLAGISVEVKKTESEGHAKTLMESIGATDAIVVAGGDGTLSEVVTGLLRKTNENPNSLPIGILPLGINNTVGKAYFPTGNKLEKIKSLAEATMAVVEETIKPADVMKIEVLNEDITNKPVYALGSIKWGAYRDAEAVKESYWIFGPFRKYATYIFNGFKNSLSWHCEAIINYTSPCGGCSNCYKRTQKAHPNSWFQKFIKEDNSQLKYRSINNPECRISHEKKISTADLALLTSNVIPNSINSTEIPKLTIEIGPENVKYFDFVKNGFRLEKGMKKDVMEIIEAKMVEINPETEQMSYWFSIDNEQYEVKPVKITLLPKIINIFCKKEQVNYLKYIYLYLLVLIFRNLTRC